MIIEHQKLTNGGIFKAKQDHKEAGILTYFYDDEGKIVANHTFVHSEFSGRGVGKKMLMELVKFVREEKLKIVAQCSFVAALFDRIEEIRDVL